VVPTGTDALEKSPIVQKKKEVKKKTPKPAVPKKESQVVNATSDDQPEEKDNEIQLPQKEHEPPVGVKKE
jgi:hypothetical protein